MNDDEAAETLSNWYARREQAITDAVSRLYPMYPDWVPSPVREHVRRDVETLLNCEQTPGMISAHVEAYLRDPESLMVPGTVLDVTAYFQAVAHLAHVKWAVARPMHEALEILAGKDAARGRASLEGVRTAGRNNAARWALRYPEYQRLVTALHMRNLHRSHWDICKEIAKAEGDEGRKVSPKTIQRHTNFK